MNANTLPTDDSLNTPFHNMHLKNKAVYDAWLWAKVSNTLTAVLSGNVITSAHDDVMKRVWTRVRAKASTP